MFNELPSLNQLLKIIQQIPYLASKNVYRVADYFLSMDIDKLEQVCTLLINARNNLQACSTCFCLQEVKGNCLFCNSTKRDHSLICVVEHWHEVLAIEKTNGYNGVYHVLCGVISPLDGVGPDDLTIDALVKRASHGAKEIIFATNQTPEGEATAAFIATKLKGQDLLISCLARGLPVGSLLGSMDRLTVFKAISERRRF